MDSGYGGGIFQSQGLKQDMRVNPRLYQAMELLYLPLVELQAHLKAELAENPFLELVEADVQEEVSLEEEEPEEEKEEVDWEEILLEGFQVSGRGEEYEAREHYGPAVVETPDLQDFLIDQLRLLPLSEREMRLGEEIVGNIDDDGLLACALDEVEEGINAWLDEVRDQARRRAETLPEEERAEELAQVEELFLPYDLSEAASMLERVQSLDPPGVAARDIRESILIQLRREGAEETLAYRIVSERFQDLVGHRWSEIAKGLEMTVQEVQDAADVISKLDPKPGLRHSPDPERYVIPELIVEKIDGEYLVFLNDTHLPRLRISRVYRKVARDRNQFQGENKEFISNKLNSAHWMIQAIEQRRQTMLKVMNYIVERQRGFFERGVQYLKPLTLREVAERIDMHESTISRVTNEKYVQTPRGVRSLKFFFSSGLATTSGGDISARGVRDKIQRLIRDEDPTKPLTDQAIVGQLRADGVKIARRTVAKYRDQLGILTARMRRRV